MAGRVVFRCLFYSDTAGLSLSEKETVTSFGFTYSCPVDVLVPSASCPATPSLLIVSTSCITAGLVLLLLMDVSCLLTLLGALSVFHTRIRGHLPIGLSDAKINSPGWKLTCPDDKIRYFFIFLPCLHLCMCPN